MKNNKDQIMSIVIAFTESALRLPTYLSRFPSASLFRLDFF